MTTADLEVFYNDQTDPLRTLITDQTRDLLVARREDAGIPRRGWLVRRMLLAADVVGLISAFAISLAVGQSIFGTAVSPSAELLLFLGSLPVWIVVAKLYGLYERDEERTDHSTVDDLLGVFHLVTVGSWLIFAATHLTPLPTEPTIGRLAVFWLTAIALVSSGRSIARALCRRQVGYLQNTVIVGAGEVGQSVGRKLLNHPEYGINLVGFVDDEPRERHESLEHIALLGSSVELAEIIRVLDVERVIFAFSNEPNHETLSLLRSVQHLDIQIDIVPRFFELVNTNVGIHTIEGIPLLGLQPIRLPRSTRAIKRTVDIIGAGFGIVLLLPLLLAIAVAVKLDSHGPIFFRQDRIGGGDRRFRIFKFRTMHVDADARKADVAHLNMHAKPGGDPRMFKVPDDPRVTRVGKLLRRLSLDELPQFLNVLRGEMSLVGPRPLIAEEDRFIADWARRRLDLRPGVTGLWQVLGASDIPFDEMTKLDYLYVTTWSFSGDIKLILKTVPSLFRTRHAY